MGLGPQPLPKQTDLWHHPWVPDKQYLAFSYIFSLHFSLAWLLLLVRAAWQGRRNRQSIVGKCFVYSSETQEHCNKKNWQPNIKNCYTIHRSWLKKPLLRFTDSDGDQRKWFLFQGSCGLTMKSSLQWSSLMILKWKWWRKRLMFCNLAPQTKLSVDLPPMHTDYFPWIRHFSKYRISPG